jgi:chloramphenicol 3-O phosphotransferase
MALPDLILLNGSSSAGKTSIARSLQAQAPEPILHFSIDDIFAWAPPAWHDSDEGFRFTPLSNGELPIVTGPSGQALMRAWRRMVRAAIDTGLKAVVDDVFLDEMARPDWAAVMAGRVTCLVAVRCDLAELQRRELARGDRGQGQALWQHERVHAYAGAYDFEVDTTATPAKACARRILRALGPA